MKVRQGFVSNSSSSSFVIVSKIRLEDIDRTKILDAFKVDKESPLFDLVDDITDLLLEAEPVTLKQHYSEDENIPFLSDEEIETYAKNGFKFYVGSACNDNGCTEEVLCDTDLDIETEDFRILKEAGY